MLSHPYQSSIRDPIPPANSVLKTGEEEVNGAPERVPVRRAEWGCSPEMAAAVHGAHHKSSLALGDALGAEADQRWEKDTYKTGVWIYFGTFRWIFLFGE